MKKLPENFKINEKTNWTEIPISYELSENFIEKYIDKLNLRNILAYQDLSENFIKKYKNKLNSCYLAFNKKISRKIKIKFGIYIKPIKSKRLFFRKKYLEI